MNRHTIEDGKNGATGSKPTQHNLDVQRAEGEGMGTMHPVSRLDLLQRMRQRLALMWMSAAQVARERPAALLGAAAGLGFVVGLLVGRRRSA